MIVMHGLFDLKGGVDEADFHAAFAAFGGHLKACELATSWRMMRRQEHAGYDNGPPQTRYYLSVEFKDVEQSERCWSYVEKNDEPLRSLHQNMNSKVHNARFFLCSDVTGG